MKIVSSINIRQISGKPFYKIYNTFTGAGKKEYHNSPQRYAIALNLGELLLTQIGLIWLRCYKAMYYGNLSINNAY